MTRRLVALLLVLFTPVLAVAQLPVNDTWLTLTTPHCRVYFTVGMDSVGRRAGAAAERAYANLSQDLVPPRGPIDVILTDAADASNGSASTFPYNRIVVNVRPPVDQTSLANYDDWLGLVLQHEMAHIFHLERSRGWWRFAQRIFGRNPVIFPNYYTPAWVAEGLAVYYESRYTTGGRLDGSYQYAIARAMAIDHHVPRLDELSLVTSTYPYGQNAYIYGSFIIDAMARHGGPGSVRNFVERTSAQTIPFLLDYNAKSSFGESFSDAWRRWRDSVTRVADTSPGIVSSADILPGGGRSIYNARWLNDSSVIYINDNGRESPGLYVVRRGGGAPVQLGRRTDVDINDPAPDGSIVFAQSEYIDRIYSRSDLYETRHDVTRQITRNQRLSAPDRNAQGTIVAVQTAPATTRLVTLPANTSLSRQTITPLMPFAIDTQWAGPRWSPDGTRIAAVRITAGTTQLVIFDSAGHQLQSLDREDAVIRSPVWSPDGLSLFYISDRSGLPQVYFTTLATGGSTSETVMQWPGGIYSVDARPAHGDKEHGTQLAAVVLRSDGFHIATASATHTVAASTYDLRAPSLVKPFTPLGMAPGDIKPYSAWTELLPTYWSPLFSSGSPSGAQIGAVTSGSDVIGRHRYVGQALVNLKNGHIDTYGEYDYSRFVSAVLSLRAEQSWAYGNVYANDGTTHLGRLDQVTRTYAFHTTFSRPRVYTYTALTVGAELETYDYQTSPDSLLAHLTPLFQTSHTYPALVAGVQFSNTQHPALSISPEDGMTLALTGRQRWLNDAGGIAIPSVVISTAGYKSLNFPGFAHHVLAVRASAGFTTTRSPSTFSVGGVSGESFEVFPGISIGDHARTFPVRGFLPAQDQGNVAISGSVEYRLPLTVPSRGLGLLPVFLNRSAISFFTDVGKATCRHSTSVTPASSTTASQSPACSVLPTAGPTLVSIGAELNIDSALQFDSPYRFRLGVAKPVSSAQSSYSRSPSFYITLGQSF